MKLMSQLNKTSIVNLNSNPTIKADHTDLIIGSFDVIHLGHKRLFDLVKPYKFNVLLILNSPKKTKYLNNTVNRVINLSKLKPKTIYLFDVTKNNLTHIEFINKILKLINPKTIIVGKDFKFGLNANGNLNHLKQNFILNLVGIDNKYHTSNLKQDLKLGKVDNVNQKILFNLVYELKILKGKQLGRQIGFPTLNSEIKDKDIVFVNNGVYATKSFINNKWYNSATYVIHEHNSIQIETYVLNKKLPYNMYDNSYHLTFLKKVNTLHKAKNVKHLKDLITTYKKEVVSYFASLATK